MRASRPQQAAAEFDAFLDLHLMILEDDHISKMPREMIGREHCNAEWALKVQMDELVEHFEAFDDAYLRERKTDVMQVVERVLKTLTGQPGHEPPSANHETNMILVAHDVSPADLIQLKPHHFSAILTDLGGATSHTAIIARGLNTPCVVGLHHARELLHENDLIVVDGEQGVVIVNPDKQILADYRLRQDQFGLERKKLKRLKSMHASTLDGTSIELHANIELPRDLLGAKENGATGIGLFRSEFLFLNRDILPDEEEQFEATAPLRKAWKDSPVTIRTFDLGAERTSKSTAPSVSPAIRRWAARYPSVSGRTQVVPHPVACAVTCFALWQYKNTGADVVRGNRN